MQPNIEDKINSFLIFDNYESTEKKIKDSPTPDNLKDIKGFPVQTTSHLPPVLNQNEILKRFQEATGKRGNLIQILIPVAVKIPPIQQQQTYNSSISTPTTLQKPPTVPVNSNARTPQSFAPEPVASCSGVASADQNRSRRNSKKRSRYEEPDSDFSSEEEEIANNFSKPKKRSLEGLSQAQKYLRIRHQNNIASKKCRDKKKREFLQMKSNLESEEVRTNQLTKQLNDRMRTKALLHRALVKYFPNATLFSSL